MARQKAEREDVREMIRFGALDMNGGGKEQWQIVDDELSITSVFSNFGPLNCLAERKTLAERLAKIVPAGGKVVLVIMGPVCIWEMAWHLAHFQPRTAFRRFRAGIPAHTGGGGTVRVWYPRAARVQKEFAPHFLQTKLVGIGAFLPPSYLSHLVDRWPRRFEKAHAWDQGWGHVFPWNAISDHYLIVLERVG